MTDTISSFHTNYTEKILEDRKREDKKVSQSIRSTKALRGKQENNSDDPFSKSDLNCRLVCIYDRITGEKRGFAKINFSKFRNLFFIPETWRNTMFFQVKKKVLPRSFIKVFFFLSVKAAAKRNRLSTSVSSDRDCDMLSTNAADQTFPDSLC